jgi:hypothetical protein
MGHAWFMVRMLALPAAYGFVAAITLIQRTGLERDLQRPPSS